MVSPGVLLTLWPSGGSARRGFSTTASLMCLVAAVVLAREFCKWPGEPGFSHSGHSISRIRAGEEAAGALMASLRSCRTSLLAHSIN